MMPEGNDNSNNTSELLKPIFKKYESKKPFLKKSWGMMLAQIDRIITIIILLLNIFM